MPGSARRKRGLQTGNLYNKRTYLASIGIIIIRERAVIFLLEIVVVAEEMAVSLYRFILTLLLCREVLCHSELDCVGDVLPSEDCCVSQNGLTYNGGGTCRLDLYR